MSQRDLTNDFTNDFKASNAVAQSVEQRSRNSVCRWFESITYVQKR